ncbi:hypothetical protein FRB95_007833, partial [Tulasnella sp. JGI-2019a]
MSPQPLLSLWCVKHGGDMSDAEEILISPSASVSALQHAIATKFVISHRGIKLYQ